MNFIEDIKEKKVEYIELIYDLIFVYVIGRNNKLLQHFENGFVKPESFAIYIVFTLAVIQIWSFSMYYINIYGKKNIREHIFFFINMFLLYFVGEGARADWYAFHTQIHVAWALILANIGVDHDQVMADIVEADAFLSEQKEYGFFGFWEKKRLMHVIMILTSFYLTSGPELIAAVVVSVLIEIQQQQAAAASAAAA